ncbi:MAG: U3-containing 90S pre-ribosomal complex subunit-domain containing protein [Benniella sp.]|nr:MAG: U3-containing 90S pre-ribosomal complex subunit-domain containing protein [Benniella sp.]
MVKHKESGDALEDDFQPSDTEFISDGEEAGVQVDNSDYDNDSDNVQDRNSASASIGSKRKAAETPKKKQQNKPKKQRTEESSTPIGKRSKAGQIAALNDSQDRALEHLSSMEREERRIPESAIKDVSPFALDHTLVHLESFLKFAVANWKSKLMIKDANAKEDQGMKDKKGTAQPRNPRDTKKKPLETSTDLPKGSPVVLIVSSSGIRAVDVIRALPMFAEAAKVGKLFAKHLKVPEQVHFLNNTVTHICTGTPNRIEKLIADGALRLDRLELVLLDCHKDAKKRTILDIQEIRVDLFKMLGLGGLEERFKSGQTQVAIF